MIEGAEREPSSLLFLVGSKGPVPPPQLGPQPPLFIPPSLNGSCRSEWLQNR